MDSHFKEKNAWCMFKGYNDFAKKGFTKLEINQYHNEGLKKKQASKKEVTFLFLSKLLGLKSL